MPTRVYITRPIPTAGPELLRKHHFKVTQGEQKYGVAQNAIIRAARGVAALLPLLTDKIDAKLMDACPQLKIVANYAVGVDNIDIPAATQRGIAVTNTPGVLTNTVAEHVIALLLCSAMRLAEADRFTRAGKFKQWDPTLLLGTDVKDKIIGIIGLGRIGSAVAEKAHGLGMKVWYHTKDKVPQEFRRRIKARAASFQQIIRQADFIVPLVPLLPSTHHLIGKTELKQMKHTTHLINASRGAVLDEAALASALKSKQIRAAALDVYEYEPTINPELFKLENVIIAPHIASASEETRGAMSTMAAQNIVDFFSGKKPKNLLNPEVFKR